MWIQYIPEDGATGFVKKEYDLAIKRSGHVAPIVKCMSLNPSILSSSM